MLRSTPLNNTLDVKPVPIVMFKNLDEISIASYKGILKGKGGIYSFINTINGKQYIGSAKDFYLRLNEHLNNRKSNVNLQKAFKNYGLDKFNWVIYEYFSFKTKIVSSKALTDLETSYIKAFDFTTLYNFKSESTSMLNYKHTDEKDDRVL